jgi:hypothetical protein
MNRTTTASLKHAVRRLNFALEIVEKSKGEYIVAQIRTNHRVRWALQRDYASGPVAVTGYRPAGDILRHIEAMLDGIAAARGLPVPRSIYDGFIKRDQPASPVFCDNCAASVSREDACFVESLRTDCASANAGESATLCGFCHGLHESGVRLLRTQASAAAVTSQGLATADGESVCEFCNRVGPGRPAVMGEDTIHYCEACRANDALGAADCCPITGDEYGTPS